MQMYNNHNLPHQHQQNSFYPPPPTSEQYPPPPSHASTYGERRVDLRAYHPDYHRNSNMHQVSSSSYPPNGYMREQGDYRDSYQSQDYPRSQGDRNSNQERKSRFSGR